MTFSSSTISPARLQKLLPLSAALLFTVLLGLELAKIIWTIVPAPEQGLWVPRPPQTVSSNANATKTTIDIAALNAAKLFGDFQVQAAASQANTEDAPDTNLSLKLRGIVAMEEEQLSRALIEADNGKLKSYALNMDLPGGASLHAIYPDRVLLKRGGRLETLRLEKEAYKTATQDTRNQRRLSASGSSAPQILGSDTAAKLSSIREELLNDPSKASQYLRVQPARNNGALKGYRIYPGRNRELFKQAGLRPGDIVTAINGSTLDDPSKSLQLLGELSQTQQLNLQIERGGQIHTVNVNLN